MFSLPEQRMVSKSLLENFFYFIFNRIDFANFLYLSTESNKLSVQDLFTLPCVRLSLQKHLWDFTQSCASRWDGATKNGEDFVGLLSPAGQQNTWGLTLSLSFAYHTVHPCWGSTAICFCQTEISPLFIFRQQVRAFPLKLISPSLPLPPEIVTINCGEICSIASVSKGHSEF